MSIHDDNIIVDSKTGIKFVLDVAPRFANRIPPEGYLVDDPACHALWMYYNEAIQAKAGVGDSIDDQILLEGMAWLRTYYKQQAETISKMYGVTVERMWQFWPAIRMECARCNYDPPPTEIVTLNDRGKT